MFAKQVRLLCMEQDELVTDLFPLIQPTTQRAMGHFVHNLDTDKLELHFDGKEEYTSLPDDVQDEIRRYYNWSRKRTAWISKAKYPGFGYAKTIAEQKTGLEDKGEKGERAGYAEKVRRKQERAEEKADRYEGYAENAAESAEQLFEKGRQMLKRIPFGQPLLKGHHSYQRDKNFRERATGKIEKSFDEKERAEYWQKQARKAKRTANGEKYSNPKFLYRRIEATEAEIRKYKRRLDDPYSERHAKKLRRLLDRKTDKLDFLQACMEEADGPLYTPDMLEEMGATHVKVIGSWYPIKRINQKTVTVNHWLGTEDSTYRVSPDKISDVKCLDGKQKTVAA